MIGQRKNTPFFSKFLLVVGALLFLAEGVSAGTATQTYDTLGRLKTVTYSSGVVITYVYDATGNRTSYTVTGAPN